MVPVLLNCFLWKIWAKYHQLAVGPGINMLRACARSGSLRRCCVTNEGNSKPCVSQKPLSCSVIHCTQGQKWQSSISFIGLVLLMP